MGRRLLGLIGIFPITKARPFSQIIIPLLYVVLSNQLIIDRLLSTPRICSNVYLMLIYRFLNVVSGLWLSPVKGRRINSLII